MGIKWAKTPKHKTHITCIAAVEGDYKDDIWTIWRVCGAHKSWKDAIHNDGFTMVTGPQWDKIIGVSDDETKKTKRKRWYLRWTHKKTSESKLKNKEGIQMWSIERDSAIQIWMEKVNAIKEIMNIDGGDDGISDASDDGKADAD